MSALASKQLIYDGSCGFCTVAAHWLSLHMSDVSCSVQPSQTLTDSDLAELGLTRTQVNSTLWWIEGADRHRASHALTHVLQHTNRSLKIIGQLLSVPPMRWLFACIYWFIAKNRNHLPGGTRQCSVQGGKVLTPSETSGQKRV